MEKVTMIRLLDGSLHDTPRSAENRLLNILSRNPCLKLFEKLAHKNTFNIRDIFIENEAEIEMTMQIVRELNEVLELKK